MVLVVRYYGIGQAVQPIAATNYGAGNLNRNWNVGKLGIKNAVLFRNLSGNPRLFNCRDESARKSEHMVAFAP